MNFKKTYTYNVSLPHSENASCPLSAFPTFRICLGNYLTLWRRYHCAGNRALAEACSIVSGRVLNRKRKGVRITVEWESAEMP